MRERLTGRDSKGVYYRHGDESGLHNYADRPPHECKEAIDRLAAYEDSGLSPEEVQELAEAKAEGRLAVLLPIDTEVFIVQDGEILGFRIYEYSLLSANNLNIRYWSECITDEDEDDLDFWADDIGVAVFLSREAAEKALE